MAECTQWAVEAWMPEVGRWLALEPGSREEAEGCAFNLHLSDPERQTRIVPWTECQPGGVDPELARRMVEDDGIRVTLDDAFERMGTTRQEVQLGCAVDEVFDE